MLTIQEQGFADAIFKGYNHSDAYSMVYNTLAMNAKTDSARIKALELLGHHLGMFRDSFEVEPVERSADEIELT